MQAGKQVEDAVGALTGALRDVGVNLDPAPGSQEAKTLTTLEGALRDRLIAAQQSNKGAPWSSDEANRIALRFLGDQVASGAVRFAPADASAARQGHDATHAITEPERRQLGAALARAGVHPGEYNIRQAYQHLKGAH